MKAAMGGGGRGMRVVRSMDEVLEAYERDCNRVRCPYYSWYRLRPWQ